MLNLYDLRERKSLFFIYFKTKKSKTDCFKYNTCNFEIHVYTSSFTKTDI